MIFYTHERNFGCRIHEYTYRGLKTLILENEPLRICVLADKGSDIFEFLYKPKDVDFLWKSPWGVRDPSRFVATSHTDASSFLDFYEGGWQDVFPTGGGSCEYMGMPFGAHGETPTIPWDYSIIEDDPERIVVRFRVRTYRTPFYLEKDLRLERGVPALFISERITNEGRMPLDVMWGQHPACGAPFVGAGCRIDLPGGLVHCEELGPDTRFREGSYEWPYAVSKEGGRIDLREIPGIEADSNDTVRVSGLPEGWFALRNVEAKVGFGMSWPLEAFPALWLWQVFGGAHSAPWYARTYTVALEPFSTARTTVVQAAEEGSARRVGPGETISASFAAVAFEGAAEVAGISADGRVSRKGEAR